MTTNTTGKVPVCSPTRTSKWRECALKHSLEYNEGWALAEADNSMLARWAGAAMAAGVAPFHRAVKLGSTVEPEEVASAAGASFDADAAWYVQHGGRIREEDRLEVRTALLKTAAKYVEADPFRGWQVHDVELTLPDHGKGRIDVGGIDPQGLLAVADVKYKRRLDARYRDSTIEDYRYDWQFAHYAWAYGEHKGHPCTRTWLCLVVGEPRFSVELVPFDVDPEYQAMWLQSARQTWADIQDEREGRRPVTMSHEHKTRFGPCFLKKACLDFHLDEGLMEASGRYIKVPRRPQ